MTFGPASAAARPTAADAGPNDDGHGSSAGCDAGPTVGVAVPGVGAADRGSGAAAGECGCAGTQMRPNFSMVRQKKKFLVRTGTTNCSSKKKRKEKRILQR